MKHKRKVSIRYKRYQLWGLLSIFSLIVFLLPVAKVQAAEDSNSNKEKVGIEIDKVENSDRIIVKTHQEIMNELNMTIVRTFPAVIGYIYDDDNDDEYEGAALGALKSGEISNLVEIKLGYFTDKNKVKYYVVAVTNLTDRVFEDGEGLSYSSKEGEEYTLSLRYIEPGETAFYLFGTSHIKDGYIDYNYFTGLTFFYNKYIKHQEYKDIRENFTFYSDGELPLDLSLKNKKEINKNHTREIYLFMLDKKGRLMDVKIDTDRYNKEDTSVNVDTDEGIPSKVFVVVNYIVEYEELDINMY